MSAKKPAGGGDDHGVTETGKKRARRVSFAEITSVHVFDRDDEYQTPPDPKPSPDHDEELAQFNRDLVFLWRDKNDEGKGDDVDEVEEERPFLRPFESPASNPGSATSNDEDNFFGPVSSSFIKPGRLSDSEASEAHEITMDSTAFSQHFRSLAKSDSGGDLKTQTGVPLSFEENTPSQNTIPGSTLGSSMLLNLAKKPISASSTSFGKFSGGGDSDDMSLVEDNPKKYDYGRLSFELDALLPEGVKDLHMDENVPGSNKNIVTQSPIHLKSRISPSKRRQGRTESNNSGGDNFGLSDIDRMIVETPPSADKLDDPDRHREKMEPNHQMRNGNLGHTETDHAMTEVDPFVDKLDGTNDHKEGMELNNAIGKNVNQTHTDHIIVEVAPIAENLVGSNGDYIQSPNHHPLQTYVDELNRHSDLLIEGLPSTKESDASNLTPKVDSHVENSGMEAAQESEIPQFDELLQPHNESPLARSLSSLSKQRQTVTDGARESEKLLTGTPQNYVLPVTDGIGRRADTVPSVQKSISKLKMLDASPFASNYHGKMNPVLMSSDSLYKTPSGSSTLYRNKENDVIKRVDASATWRDQSPLVTRVNREIDTISNMNLSSIRMSENLIDGSFSRGPPGISKFLTSPTPRSTEVLASEQSNDLARVKSLLFQLTWSGKKTELNRLTSEDSTGRINVTPGRDSFLTRITHDHQKIIKATGTPHKSVHSLEESTRDKNTSKVLQGITSKDEESTIKIVDEGYVDRIDNAGNASLSTTIVKELDSAFREIADFSQLLLEINNTKEPLGLETSSDLKIGFHNVQDEVRLEGSSQPRPTNEDSRYLVMNGNLDTGKDPELNKDFTGACLQSSTVSPPPSVNKNDGDPSSPKKLIVSSRQSPSRKRLYKALHGDELSSAASGKPLLPNSNQLTHEYEDLSARKRTRNYVISEESVYVDEIGRHRKSPKVHKSVGQEIEVLSGHHNGSNIETSIVGHDPTLKHFSDVLSEFLAKKMLPSTDQLHLQAISEVEDILVKLQRLQTYEMHHKVIQPQKSVENLANLQHKKVGEAKILLHKIFHKHAKLQLMRVKQEKLLRNVQVLKHGVQEAQSLKLNSLPLISARCNSDADINGSHCQSNNIQGREEEEVPGKKVTALRQLRETLESKISSLTKSLHSSCKLKGISSHSDTVSAVNSYLKKRACCKFLRSDMQLWKVHNLSAVNGNRDLVLSYLDFITQRITIKVGSSSISSELNDCSMLKSFPNMDADTALTFVVNTIVRQKYVGSPSMTQETQITSSVLGNLVDVAEEIQQARFELQNLTYTGFVSLSVGQLELQLHFIGRKSGRKVVLTLDMSCLKWGIYPSDITPYKLECSSEQLSAEIKAVIQSLGVGYWRLLRICTTVSEVVQAWSE